MYKVINSAKFDQQFEILIVNNTIDPKIVLEKIKLFQKNPFDTRLRNHKLTKRMSGKWAFSITDDIRIVYEWLGKTTVRFLAVGDHHTVYSRNLMINDIQSIYFTDFKI